MGMPRLALLLALAAPAGWAQDAPAGAAPGWREATLEVRQEHLDSGLGDWNAVRIGVARGGAWSPGWQAAVSREERFGDIDTAIEGGIVRPLDDRWMLQAEAGAAPDADILARWHAELRVVRRLRDGWLVTGGVRRAAYVDARVLRAGVDVERYVGAWRFALGHDRLRLHGETHGQWDLAIDRYLGDRDRVALRLAHGHDVGLLPGGLRVPARTRAAWVQGSHWVSPRWGVDWAVGHVDQAHAYDRTWVQAGLRRAF